MEAKTKNVHLIQTASGQILDVVRQVCDALQILSLKRSTDVCSSLVHKNPLIDVAILGQFKAGKSSFLNSLIGRRLLPVGVTPVTTVITRIQHGEKERAIVSHFDGSTTEISLDDLVEYTSEAKNPANQKDVAVVDIDLPSMEDYAGLRLVDTPGLGSVFKYHMETSENWLPEVGAAILAISADRPLSEHDLNLIRDLLQHTPRIVLLLTKADLLQPDQQQEVVQFFKDTMKRELKKELPIFLYSNRDNVEKFKHRMEMELLYKLSMNRDAEFGRILQYKALSLAKNCQSYLEIALKTSRQADTDREALKEQILGEKGNFTQINEDLIAITRTQSIHTRTNIEKYLDRFKRPLHDKLVDTLRHEMPQWQGNLWKLTRRYEEWLRENLIGELDEISAKEHKHFFGTLMKAHASLDRYLESFRALLGANIERVLGIKMASAEWKLEVTPPSRPDISIGHIFLFHFDLLWFLIPMAIFRGHFERHFINQLANQVYVNTSRLASQWEERINRAIEEMRKQAANYIRDEMATIEALLSQNPGRTNDIRQLTTRLEAASRQLAGG
ncbi:MAG: dynamin family protein [Syntrophales bacterium]|jgi:small GTP-binding protein|nr:dynamin family protein [Syntrophales bacterium]